jgi:hypothetical protein
MSMDTIPVPAEQTSQEVPANSGPRPSTSDRLRKRGVRQEVVDLGDGLQVLVKGLDADTAFDMGELFEDADDVTPREATPPLLRATCYDVETGERLFDESWTDEEITQQAIDVVTKLAEAANRVMGRDGGPGKD